MSRQITIAVLQCALGGSRSENIAVIDVLVRRAAAAGAQLIVPPELFELPYFPQAEDEALFEHARPLADNSTIAHFAAVAAELGVSMPISFFERAEPAYYNTVAMLDADGRLLGTYRKSHLPDGPGYEEKYYFRPGDTGFRVFETRFAKVGVGICWDQWFPEAARAMALGGAELLIYPTAIGSEPEQPEIDTKDPWQRVMVGHAVANAMPVAAANRVGLEDAITFYGASFICNARGDMVAELDGEEGIAQASFNLDTLRRERAGWGFFRDRRPELYGRLIG